MNIPWPSADWACPVEYYTGLRSNVLIRSSSLNGSIQTSELPSTRWIVRLRLPPNVDEQDVAPLVEAFAARVEGQVNRIVMPHLKRKVPRGTARGPLYVSTPAPVGARSIMILDIGKGTLLPGDILGIPTLAGVQRVIVTQVIQGDPMIVNFSPPLRAAAVTSGTVIWDAPTSTFISTRPELLVGYGTSSNPGFEMELVETFA